MQKTIVVADDHAITAQGLAAALDARKDCKVVAIANNGIEAISLIRQHTPDCAVLDLEMPGANGFEVLMECKRWVPHVRIMVITGAALSAKFFQLQKAGACGIFSKTETPEVICQGIYDVACGKQAFGAEVKKYLESVQEAQKLTARELEVLIGLSRGLSNQGIADRLGISPKTIDSHRTTLMRKMGVRSTASLMVRSMRDGLI